MTRGLAVNRLEKRLAALRYRAAATSGAVTGALLGPANWIAGWLPALQPHRPVSLLNALADSFVGAIVGASLLIAGTALLRGWTRKRAARLARPAV
jgi:hypothetical protein